MQHGNRGFYRSIGYIVSYARKGILSQTRRHHRIVTMMGIRHIVLAVNKMDLVDFQENIFHSIEAEFRNFTSDSRLRPFKRFRSQPFLVRTYSRQALRCHGIRADFIEYLDNIVVDDQVTEGSFACQCNG